MKCPYCKREVENATKFCSYCGHSLTKIKTPTAPTTPPIYYVAQPAPQPTPTNGYAIAGFVLAFIFSLLGLIFSLIGRSKAKTIGSGEGLAIAGMIISTIRIALVFIIFFLAFCVALLE